VGLEWCGELMDLAYGGENGERLVKEDIFRPRQASRSSQGSINTKGMNPFLHSTGLPKISPWSLGHAMP